MDFRSTISNHDRRRVRCHYVSMHKAELKREAKLFDVNWRIDVRRSSTGREEGPGRT